MAKRESPKNNVDRPFLGILQEKMAIDKFDLDTMWVDQPETYPDIADRLALEISRRDRPDLLADVEGGIDTEIHGTPKRTWRKNGAKKPTGTAIKNMVRADKRWKKADELSASLIKTSVYTQALKETFMQRRYALENLTTLHVSGYGMDSVLAAPPVMHNMEQPKSTSGKGCAVPGIDGIT